MSLVELRIHRAPGLPRGLWLAALQPGIVLLVGPNGSGKSTAGRVLRQALWGEAPASDVEATVRWSSGARCELARGQALWQGERPAAPASGSGAWRMSLAELLSTNGAAERDLAADIARALNGGVDLAAAAASARRNERGDRVLSRAVEDAAEQLHLVREAQARLERERTSLSTLERDLREAEAAQRDLSRWTTALTAAEARARVAALDEQLAAEPEVLRSAGPQLRERLQRCHAEELDARAARDRLDDALAGYDASDDDARPSLADLRTWRADATLLGQLEAELAAADLALAARPACEPPTDGDLDALAAAVHAHADALAAELAARHALEAAPPAPLAEVPLGVWPAALTLATSAVLLALGLLAAWWLGDGWVALAAAAALLPGAGLAAWWLVERAGQTHRAAQAQGAADATAGVMTQRAARAAEAVQRARHERDALAVALGLTRPTADLPLLAWVSEVQGLREQAAAYAAAKRARAHLSQRVAALQQQLAGALDLTPSVRATRAIATVDALAEARAQRSAAERERDQLARERDRAAETLRERADATLRALAELGLDREAPAAVVAQRLDALDRVRHSVEARAIAAGTLASLSAELPASLRELPATVVRARRDAAATLADTLPERGRAVATLRARLEEAERGHTLADARAAYASALDDVERARDAIAEDTALRALCAWVERGVEAEQAPAVLERARRWLLRFTRGRYHLTLDREGGLATVDREDGAARPLAALSDGSRAQVLLAARMAWLESQEAPGQPLPLFLDEALATTDPARLRAVLAALAEVARGGRQVLYATASPAEASTWAAVLRELGEAAPQRCDLVPSEEPPPEVAPSEPVPPPSEDLPAWRRAAGVTGANGWSAATSWSAAWLFLDAYAPARLLTAGVRTVGQLQALSAAGLPLPLSEPDAAVALQRAEALDRLLSAWRIGRGAAVPWELVASADVLTAAFRERVAALHASHGGDARAFLVELRALPRFRSANADLLEERLRDAGLVDERLSLGEDALVLHSIPDGDGADDPDFSAWVRHVVRAIG